MFPESSGPIVAHLLRDQSDYMTFEITTALPSNEAEDPSMYDLFYVANTKCFLIEARARFRLPATDSTARVDVVKVADGADPNSAGVSMLASTFNVASTANRVQRKGPTATLANAQLNPGNAVGFDTAGSMTDLRALVVTLLFGVDMKNIPFGQSVSTVISGI